MTDVKLLIIATSTMKTRILSFSAPEDYELIATARQKAEGMTRSEYLRKCIRDDAERAAARQVLAVGGGFDMRGLLAALAH